MLDEFGIDCQDVLLELGLDPALLRDPTNRVPYRDIERLLLRCEQLTGCDCIGLRIGQTVKLRDMGWIGRVAASQATAREGLHAFSSNYNLYSTAAIVVVERAGRHSRWIFAVCAHGLSDTRHNQMGAAAIMFNILRELCGREWLPTRVSFACSSPRQIRPLERFFCAPLQFDQEQTAITFENRWLDAILTPVAAEVRRAVMSEIEGQRVATEANLPSVVRFILRKKLLLDGTSMDALAHLLSMHRRTLDRRLKRHGVRYRDLVEATKRDVALQLLLDTRLHVRHIAESLHYSSPANFATAFRRWSGVTPSVYRTRALRRSARRRAPRNPPALSNR